MALDAAQALMQAFDPATSSLKIVVNGYLWTKYTKVYADFSTAGTTNSIALFTLPPGGVIHNTKIKHSVAFSGTSISAYTVQVGISGTLNKYSGSTAFNVFQAVANTTFGLYANLGSENHAAGTSILVTATSTGANLNAASGAGSVDIWVLTSQAL